MSVYSLQLFAVDQAMFGPMGRRGLGFSRLKAILLLVRKGLQRNVVLLTTCFASRRDCYPVSSLRDSWRSLSIAQQAL